MTSGGILERILDVKRQELEAKKAIAPLSELKVLSRDVPPPRNFKGALRCTGISLIAEIKKASPSKGVICEDFNPVEIAQKYERGGAKAISVLTDEQFFRGHIDYIGAVKEVVNLPLLRKDFIIDPYQVYESRLIGADAVLLIAAALDENYLNELYNLVKDLGMVSLVEVHNREELERALDGDLLRCFTGF